MFYYNSLAQLGMPVLFFLQFKVYDKAYKGFCAVKSGIKSSAVCCPFFLESSGNTFVIRQKEQEKMEQSIPPQGYSTGKQRMQDDEISIYPQTQQAELRKLRARNPEILFITLEEANFGG